MRVRRIARRIVPEAEEVINFGMPVIKHKGKYVIGFSAFKEHLSVFPGAEAVEAVKPKLDAFKTSEGLSSSRRPNRSQRHSLRADTGTPSSYR